MRNSSNATIWERVKKPRFIFYSLLMLLLITLYILGANLLAVVLAILVFAYLFIKLPLRPLIYASIPIGIIAISLLGIGSYPGAISEYIALPLFYILLAALASVGAQFVKFPWRFSWAEIRLSPQTVAVSTIIIVAIFLTRPVVGEPGLIFSGDFAFPYNISAYFQDRLSAWSEAYGVGTFQDIAHIAFLGPIILLSKAFGLGVSVFSKFIITLPYLIAGIGAYLFVSEITPRLKNGFHCYAALVSGLIYMLSPWLMSRQAHFFIQVGYAFLPLALYFYIRALRQGKLINMVLAAIFIGLAGVTPHYLAYTALALILLFLVYMVRSIYLKKAGNIKKILLRTLYIFIIFLLLFAFWVLPLSYTHLVENELPSPTYILRTGDIVNGNQEFDCFGLLTLVSRDFESLAEYVLWIVAAAGIIILSLAGFWHNRKNMYAWFLFILSGVAVALPVLFLISKNRYFEIMFSIPLSWLLHDPFRTLGLLALGLSGLVGFFLYYLITRKNALANK